MAGMSKAGFGDIGSKAHKIPVKRQARTVGLSDAGHYAYAALTGDPEGDVLFLATEVMGWNKQRAIQWARDFNMEMRSMEPCYFLQHSVWGTKPHLNPKV
ncbi:hypothetical protein COL940_006730 [Colletotrichum noveboracense]|nr:hypothetical protein COL940_006730 [Colletotrichum noveboracense]